MKRMLTVAMVSAGIATMSLAPAHAGEHEWATAGKILTGVMAVGLLANMSYAAPPCREVVYCPPPMPAASVVPAPPPCGWYAPPRPHHGRTTVICAPPARCVESTVVVVQPSPAPVIVQAPATETVWIQNSNGSRTPIELRRTDGGMYVGPKGEYYLGLPANEQLRQIYGM